MGKEILNTTLTRILIVDDDMVNQLIACEILKRNGFDSVAANSGAEALEIVKNEFYFDIILMDIYMPEMDGMMTCRALRNVKGYENTPILAVSGNSLASDKDACFEAGMNDYIIKPFVAQELLTTIQNWTKLSRYKIS